MKAGDIAAALGKGLVAGAAGTAAITAFTMVEARVRGREPSTAPADAAEKLVGVEPRGDREKQRLGNAMHWLYGTSLGAVRGLLAALGLREPAASGVHFGLVQGAAMTMPAGLGIAPPPTKWGAKEIALDAVRHAVYATAAGLTFELLDRRSERTRIAADPPKQRPLRLAMRGPRSLSGWRRPSVASWWRRPLRLAA